ncbi:zinc ribbon domain-containing protein [Enterococcus ureasiticus]|uniref:Zinc-ribbon domain-containing protein n=1 Tax=Enterococcus ureasiticus TaxID=903984 RepID=A0A1E5G9Y4_9ENTE|nr:zinc ribbon domain-containing protein [Enterococcus ureasiticus]OEG09518.1 hypothetical protein BCR21_14295 [Enterococcus ureasiticus]
MKECKYCHTQNSDSSNFCEQCGTPLDAIGSQKTTPADGNTATNESYQMNQPKANSKNIQPLLIGAIVALLGIIIGIILFIYLKPNNNTEISAGSSQTETRSTTKDSSQTETTSSKKDLENYDEIIKAAKELNIEGKYKESELKLASIPVSALGKPEWKTIKEAVEKLANLNNKGLQEQKNSTEKVQANDDPSTFTGDLAKWANTYTFYYSQNNQRQSRLTIATNGGVTQSNYDGTQYFGRATIANASGDILSYNTDTLYPMRMPSTKTINPNVKITIQWDNNGGSQNLYGYLSYSSRLALTDGQNKGGGVNEVWITY